MPNKKLEKLGNITAPRDALVQPHELVVATILAWTGDDVEFIPVIHVHTPDIRFRGLEWEIKSPLGSSSRTLENNIRSALRQSNNIIVDLSRMKLPEEECLREVKRQDKLIKGKHRIIVITKDKNILKLYKK